MSTKEYWENNTDIGYRDLGWKQNFFAQSLAGVVQGKRVLEIGCGGGALSYLLTQFGASVVGIDFSESLIRIAKSKFPESADLMFREADLLSTNLKERFDIICGIAVLHEIPYKDTPNLLGFFDGHLNPGGFGWFQENSFFNPMFRLVRKRLVGRYGIPKYGSDEESPFDSQRFELYKQHFRFCERSAEIFSLFSQINRYFFRSHNSTFSRIMTKLDRRITDLQLPPLLMKNLSYWQHIYFSHSTHKRHVFNSRFGSSRTK